MPSFCVPTPEDLTLKSPHPLEFAIHGKKMLMPGGQPGLERDGGVLGAEVAQAYCENPEQHYST